MSALSVVVRRDGIVLAADRALALDGVELMPGVPPPAPDAPKLFLTPGGLGVALVGKATAANPVGAAVDLRSLAVAAASAETNPGNAATALVDGWEDVADHVRAHAGGGEFPVPPWTVPALTVAVVVGAGRAGPTAYLAALPPTGSCWHSAVLASTSFAPEEARADLALAVVEATAAPSLESAVVVIVDGIRRAASKAPAGISLTVDSVTVDAGSPLYEEHVYVREKQPPGW